MCNKTTVTNHTPQQIFINVYNGYNSVITPNIVTYTIVNNGKRVIELSKGDGIKNNLMYAVTVIDYNSIDGGWDKTEGLNKLFDDLNPLQSALDYMKTL